VDSITQALLGATIAEAGFRTKLGGRAVVWGAFCGLAPDLDFVAAIGNEWNELLHHRGVSHSLIALTAAAPLLGALAWRWPGKRQGTVFGWIHLTFWALITHPLLDACTAYGTQLLAPRSTERFAIAAVSIVDLAYTLPLLFAVVRAWRGRDRRKSARFAAAMLALTSAYLGFGFVQSQRAIAWAEEDLRALEFPSVETRALPTIGNLFVFRVIARDGRGSYRAAIVSLSAPRRLRWYAIDDDVDPLVERARRTERAHIFEWFAMDFAHADLIHEDHGFTVRLSDVRYGSMVDLRRSMWGADARFGLEGHLLGVERWSAVGERDMRAEFLALWAHLTGDDALLRELTE
jgi:inner membrane protein